MTLGSRLTLLDLPRDVLEIVIDNIGVRIEATRDSIKDLTSLARTCKKLRSYMEPHLYYKIYTGMGPRQDTGSVSRLLRKRPDIGLMIHELVLDDFDHRQIRYLLSNEFPLLQRLLIQQHEGDIPKSIRAHEKRILNKILRPQPMLNHLTRKDVGNYTRA